MRYASIRSLDITNGEGVGISLFVQGCNLHCQGCFNPKTWDFNGGKEWTKDIQNQFIELAKRPYIKRISILGGEPLAEENRPGVLNLILDIKTKLPNKNIWLYTGYELTIDDFINGTSTQRLIINLCDVIIDGPYIEDQRDITLTFRGSKNQRLIDVKETLKQNKIIIIQND